MTTLRISHCTIERVISPSALKVERLLSNNPMVLRPILDHSNIVHKIIWQEP